MDHKMGKGRERRCEDHRMGRTSNGGDVELWIIGWVGDGKGQGWGAADREEVMNYGS